MIFIIFVQIILRLIKIINYFQKISPKNKVKKRGFQKSDVYKTPDVTKISSIKKKKLQYF